MSVSIRTNVNNNSWDCWVDDNAHVLSFHEVKGYQWQFFRSKTAFWLYIQAKTMEGYLVM